MEPTAVQGALDAVGMVRAALRGVSSPPSELFAQQCRLLLECSGLLADDANAALAEHTPPPAASSPTAAAVSDTTKETQKEKGGGCAIL